MIAIGCDHGGFELKEAIVNYLKEKNLEFKDFGIYENVSVDYPDIAKKVCESIQNGECELGILVCGTGIGMSLAANKHKGIRAAALSEHFSAKYTRLHNNSNVLCLGARVLGAGLALDLVNAFVDAEFEGDRHTKRLSLIEDIENGKSL